MRNYPSLLISLPNKTCKSVLSFKCILALFHLCSSIFLGIAVIIFFLLSFMKFNPNIHFFD